MTQHQFADLAGRQTVAGEINDVCADPQCGP
jgi:hypothetical protein